MALIINDMGEFVDPDDGLPPALKLKHGGEKKVDRPKPKRDERVRRDREAWKRRVR